MIGDIRLKERIKYKLLILESQLWLNGWQIKTINLRIFWNQPKKYYTLKYELEIKHQRQGYMFTAQGNNKGILRRTFWGAVEEIEYVNTTLDGCIFVIS